MVMTTQIQLSDITVDVVLKNIRNIHLRVYPPDGRVRISAPRRMGIDAIRAFAASKLDWIKRQQARLREQPREPPREYVDREGHSVWGKRYLLSVVEHDAPPSLELGHRRLLLRVRPGTDVAKRRVLVEAWYREQIRAAVPTFLARWQPLLGVRARRFFVRRMKTRWGSCNYKAHAIRLNTELARKPPECLEYVVVHELTHLLEPSHNARFTALMDRAMPDWRHRRDQLNRMPVPHDEWLLLKRGSGPACD